MISYPIQHLLDEEKSYAELVDILHPEGLHCPAGHELPEGQAPHDRTTAPRLSYRCRECGRVFNALTGTVWSRTQYSSRVIILLMRGFVQGRSTQQLSDEMELDYSTVLKWRHRVQAQAQAASEQQMEGELPDKQVEADEVFQNAGQKGDEHDDSDDPPRQHSNPRRGRGTYANDRPVIAGVVGRQSSIVQISVEANTKTATLTPLYDQQIGDEATLYTDQAHHLMALSPHVDAHHTVAHGSDEFARDPDGDDFHQVHVNTLEGIWTGLRAFLRRLRGVHKQYLAQYVAMYEWAVNLGHASDHYLRMLMQPDFTFPPI